VESALVHLQALQSLFSTDLTLGTRKREVQDLFLILFSHPSRLACLIRAEKPTEAQALMLQT